MRQTPRVKTGGAGSSLPSDRIPPRPSSSSPFQPGSRAGKQKQAASVGAAKGTSKSPEVLRLESLVKALRESTGTAKDPKGGCFCLARDHPLSAHVRICESCGLILCSLNLPHYACPSCTSALLSSEERKLLIANLEQQIIDTLAREADEKERAAEEAKRAAGAFPTLLDSIQQPQPQYPHQKSTQNTSQDGRPGLPPLAQDTHKVMSLRTKPGSNKVVISSYRPSTAGSRPASRGPDVVKEQEKEDDVKRVLHPGNEPKHASRKVDPSRPWENLLGRSLTYVPQNG